jgi:hypothetical protein
MLHRKREGKGVKQKDGYRERKVVTHIKKERMVLTYKERQRERKKVKQKDRKRDIEKVFYVAKIDRHKEIKKGSKTERHIDR